MPPPPSPRDLEWPVLPDDVMVPIFYYMDMRSIMKCQRGCVSWYAMLVDHDEYLWKPKVRAICPQGLLPRKRKGELWKDIYQLYFAWLRPMTIQHFQLTTHEVTHLPLPNGATVLPNLLADAKLAHPVDGCNGMIHGSTVEHPEFELLAAFIASRDDDGKAVLAARHAVVCSDRIVYLRMGKLHYIRFTGKYLMQEETDCTIFVGDEPRIDPGIRSNTYAVAGSECTVFRDMDTDAICAIIEDEGTEEGVLCGNLYAAQAYNPELMRASLELFALPEPVKTGYDIDAMPVGPCPPLCSMLDIPASVPRLDPIAVVDHIDDSLNAVILNDHFLAYRTWSSDRIHPIIIVRWKDRSEYATLLLDDMDENLVLHLILSRLHLIVLCGTGHYVYIYELATMKRLHSFNLFELIGDLGTIDWVKLSPDENAIIFGVDGGCLLWFDIRNRRAVLYFRPSHEENTEERGLWIVYRGIKINGNYPPEQVVCRIFDTS
ncbi:hypothetical protein HDU87_007832 [Geranomyces variabilis]|uniref:F-box domain-containing protein n=1 Tax=Geranomyces variabilis TaxID=109894 RepID=A0AAD5TDH2_9FUNG|nr:hypothetical protein HDU87_007832 [Geranomyces variabilis]